MQIRHYVLEKGKCFVELPAPITLRHADVTKLHVGAIPYVVLRHFLTNSVALQIGYVPYIGELFSLPGRSTNCREIPLKLNESLQDYVGYKDK